jgi:hypothetical protein
VHRTRASSLCTFPYVVTAMRERQRCPLVSLQRVPMQPFFARACQQSKMRGGGGCVRLPCQPFTSPASIREFCVDMCYSSRHWPSLLSSTSSTTCLAFRDLAELVSTHHLQPSHSPSMQVFFHTDAAQAVGKIPIDVNGLNIDLMSISGHKLYGPKGVGALYVRRRPRVRLEPQMNGGGQERGLRSGTVPTGLAVGLGAACKLAGKVWRSCVNCRLRPQCQWYHAHCGHAQCDRGVKMRHYLHPKPWRSRRLTRTSPVECLHVAPPAPRLIGPPRVLLGGQQ